VSLIPFSDSLSRCSQSLYCLTFHRLTICLSRCWLMGCKVCVNIVQDSCNTCLQLVVFFVRCYFKVIGFCFWLSFLLMQLLCSNSKLYRFTVLMGSLNNCFASLLVKVDCLFSCNAVFSNSK
jgi:hypothetical protein